MAAPPRALAKGARLSLPTLVPATAEAIGGVPVLVTAAVLGAAVMHAAWNALAKSLKDHLVGFAVLEATSGAVALGAALFVPGPGVAALPYLAASVAAHTAYQALLLNSYRVGEFNQVYPIARGTAPLVVTLLAVPFAHEAVHGLQAAGVIAVAGGLVLLADLRVWWATGRPPALALAFATGLLIASYSLVDGLGVRRAHSAVGYASWLMAAEALPIPLYAVLRQPGRVRLMWPSTWRRAALGGVLSLLAYSVVLWAQTRGALGAVAALRETGVVVGAGIGALFFGERLGRRRVIAAAVVATGVILLNSA